MADYEVLVVGGGISGASFALQAARAGKTVLVAEKEERVGGCLHTERLPDGYWFELGAHTCYNSYGAFLELLEACGLSKELQARGKPVLRFLEGTQVVPGKNLWLLLRLFQKGELLGALPRWFGASQEGQTVRSFYSRLVGKRNYERVLGPMLSAVPSQAADAFPADMLFKKRERRKDVMRSFTLRGGLQSAVDVILRQPGIETTLGRSAVGIERSDSGFVARFDDGSRVEARALALAVPPGTAAGLLRDVFPESAARAATIAEASVDSLGFAVRAEKVRVPYSTFLIPLRDEFHSIVTRDVVPDPAWRAFTVHFRPGHSREEQLRRVAEVLGVQQADMRGLASRQAVLPSPVLGHAAVIEGLDRNLARERVALTGNWFGGLAIEDCALRSRAEWARVEALA